MAGDGAGDSGLYGIRRSGPGLLFSNVRCGLRMTKLPASSCDRHYCLKIHIHPFRQ